MFAFTGNNIKIKSNDIKSKNDQFISAKDYKGIEKALVKKLESLKLNPSLERRNIVLGKMPENVKQIIGLF